MKIFFALNRNTRRAVLMDPEAFPTWRHVQHAFGLGILMPDGNSATGIGRVRSRKEFFCCALAGGWTVLPISNEVVPA